MKRLVLLVVALLALMASTSSAGAGGHAAHGSGLDPDCVELFSSLGKLTSGSTARGFQREPVLRNAPKDSEIDGAEPSTSSSFGTSVRTFVHVITNGDEGFVDPGVINQQMGVLNAAFAGFYGPNASRTGFRFNLRDITYTDNAAWFDAYPESAEEREMKSALKRGGPRTLNIYLTNAAEQQLLGWAYFPKINKRKKDRVLDGVIVNYASLPGGPFGSQFSLGQTTTHEVGHWLGLYHTFEDGCGGRGDRIDDTPAELEPTSGCPEGKDTCPQPGFDPIHNFMDYSFDSCYQEFTKDQSRRMQRQWLHWREGDRDSRD
jgi:hypothetical protein